MTARFKALAGAPMSLRPAAASVPMYCAPSGGLYVCEPLASALVRLCRDKVVTQRRGLEYALACVQRGEVTAEGLAQLADAGPDALDAVLRVLLPPQNAVERTSAIAENIP